MMTVGWIKEFKDKASQLNEVLRFFGINSPNEWEVIWGDPEAAFRQSPAFERDSYATSAWLRKGQLEGQKIACQPYNKKYFQDVLKTLRNYTRKRPEDFEDVVRKICASTGVAVVFVPPLKGVPVYGAGHWITPRKALIQLSLRGKYEDKLWFTFFHEAGHILQHKKKVVFIDSKSTKEDEEEKKANKFAENLLIPPEAWNNLITTKEYKKRKVIEEFAKEQKISPAIVVGRLQIERLIPHSYLNDLRHKYDFI